MTAARVAFADFWDDFNEADWFTPLLSRVVGTDQFVVVPPSERPDILIFSLFGRLQNEFKDTPVRKVFFTGENFLRTHRPHDFALSFDLDVESDQHMRVPLWQTYSTDLAQVLCEDQLRRWGLSTQHLHTPTRPEFCTWVASAHCEGRNQFVQQLSAHVSSVACGGKMLNNVGGPVEDKGCFLQSSRFSVAMENASRPGYCTEKLLQAFGSGGVPIYWGDPNVARDFNPKAFVNVHDFETYTALWTEIKALNEDASTLAAMLREPIFTAPCRARLTSGKEDWEAQLVRGILGPKFRVERRTA